jgi:hypothetical protein
MFEIKKLEASKHLKPVFYKDSVPIDPLITFQPKSAPPYPPCTNSQDLIPNSKNTRGIPKSYPYQDPHKKPNLIKALPPLPRKPALTNSAISIPVRKSSRFCLKSDSKPSRSKKTEILEAMNSSSMALSEFFNQSNENSGRFIGREVEEMFAIKTPTFSGEDRELEKKERIVNEQEWLGLSEVRSLSKDCGEGSASKLTQIGSSVSTEFPVLSPRSIQDQKIFKQYWVKNKPGVVSRDHPKIRVRKTGLPKDVFTIKY